MKKSDNNHKNTVIRIVISLVLILILCISNSAFHPETVKVYAKEQKTSAGTSLNYTRKQLTVGDSFTLKVKGATKKYKFTSSDRSVATVGKKAGKKIKIRAKSEGTALITADCGTEQLTCLVTVYDNKHTKCEYVGKCGKTLQEIYTSNEYDYAANMKNYGFEEQLDYYEPSLCDYFLKRIDQIIDEITKPEDELWEKIMAVHDWIALRYSYYERYCTRFAIGALSNDYFVCSSYSDLFNLFMIELGIPSRYIIGEAANGAHGWNAVKLDDGWYYIDVTWDDPGSYSSKNSSNVKYSYFLLTETAINKDHTPTGDLPSPAGKNTGYKSKASNKYSSRQTYESKLYSVKLTSEYGNYRYIINDSGTVTITGYMDRNVDGDILVPEKIGGKKVSHIGSCAFYNSKITGDVLVPAGIAFIGKNVFGWNNMTGYLVLENNNTYIEYGEENVSWVIEVDGAWLGVEFVWNDFLVSQGIPVSLAIRGASIPDGCEELIIPGDISGHSVSTITSLIIRRSEPISIVLPDSVVLIEEECFLRSSALKSIVLSKNLKMIGSNAFDSCTGLTGISIPKSITYIGHSVFNNCTSLKTVSLPAIDMEVGSNIFSGCTSFTEITLPAGMKTLARNLFYGAESLKKVVLPKGLESIGAYAFYGCTALTDIKIPDSVTSIGLEAFDNCISLTDITIPSGVKKIDCFSGCTGLKNITLPKGLTSIAGFYGCTGLSGIVIPDTVTKIESNAFRGCTGLTGITLPSGIEYLGYSAFEKCSNLTNIILPLSLESIGRGAFMGCSSLEEVVIPSSVKELESYIFYDCNKLERMYVHESHFDYEYDSWVGSKTVPEECEIIYYEKYEIQGDQVVNITRSSYYSEYIDDDDDDEYDEYDEYDDEDEDDYEE